MGVAQKGFVGGRNGRFGFLEVHLVEGQATPLNADVPQQVHEFGILRFEVCSELLESCRYFVGRSTSQIVEEIARFFFNVHDWLTDVLP